MASTTLTEPIVARSGASVHSREEDEFTEQNEENPLEITSNSSVQDTPSHMVADNLLENIGSHDGHPDEPPPPYEEPIHDANPPQIVPVEYSCENRPQLLAASQSEFPEALEPPPRNPARLSRDLSGLPPISLGVLRSPDDDTLYPAPLQIRPSSANGGQTPGMEFAQRSATFSSAKAREAGFEVLPPRSPHRTDSNSSFPSITMVSSTETLRHTREPGKLTAYLIPFPKPRLKGVRVEDIPDRFLVYTPTPPPLSKPAPGEKESHWHKTQRQWQEDVRKAMMSNASKATWKGLKARTTILIGKGVNLTKSTQLEFLDRVSEGAITATVDETNPLELTDAITTPSTEQPPTLTPNGVETTPSTPLRTESTTSIEKTKKTKALEELTLIYPPTLPLDPERIRSEFVDSLLRTRDKSRRDAVVASSLFPVAAAIDASLLITFGGLMEVSGVWAYTSIKGAVTSKKMTQGLARGEEYAKEKANEETKIVGCTCGLHEQTFGCQHSVTVSNKGKGKGKGKGKAKRQGINLRMQQSPKLEVLRRYLDLACLKKEFIMFPQLDELAGDVDDGAVLQAIGWQPTRRAGRDLEMEYKGRIETLTPEQDEQWQIREAKDDVRRIMKKGAKEWIEFCKQFQKDHVAALKK
ncbi:uncharacterized protein BDR25DRAFT_306979 [Lindgomyces ingoldianus]|uniref:Uncharacterized protein n=1 Tax=Lindgomyces ingoldianus TaxID=673940 RepID=A0ACB6QDD9_9PLEO|nr:uncharacterized protein BDR25DRAFT_306979 [Lindgomyces ingoldianus]KAF2464912.1 hypothetical protein BDR25DRAFT_306979 [Lindgomyces ingoldianus]